MKNEPSLFENETTSVQEYHSTGIASLGTVQEITQQLEQTKAIKQAIFSFIDEMFKEGIDYGKAVSASEKPTLLLPGAEKLAGHFNLMDEYEVDEKMHDMLGKPEKTVCLICYLVNRSTGQRIGMGRGACVIGEKAMGIVARDTNGSIKIAEKRAFVNVVKRTFMLSEKYTQDREMVNSFIEEKNKLLVLVQTSRSGIKSELNNKQWLSKVCWEIIKKRSISTKTELEMVLNDYEQYDYATGEKLDK